ncbi:sensor histidine kinase [Dyadobacter sediminis]|uniref:histidine kinase n=1 Tax=Dyadobacter sediminis TaxID=1493691 RepID=A0A5R9KMK0_9BACT|nr:ATP-binding protein [Dyadobacter sediminis]TLU97445.1 hypothetical protein FEM55_00500 [Dyadobacter sediminis]GGC15065.1 hypothetical protein GCM10011325_47370 [Dyadobacter sediminis]
MSSQLSFFANRTDKRAYQHFSSLDWNTHPLGSVDNWSGPLLHSFKFALGNQQPSLILWGETLWQFYNDAYCSKFCHDDLKGIGKSALDAFAVEGFNIRALTDQVRLGSTCCMQQVEASGTHEQNELFDLHLSPIWNHDGEPEGILIAAQQCSTPSSTNGSGTKELYEASQQLILASHSDKEKIRMLEKTNTSLESFAYTASHDLQEPVRKIKSFATLLNAKLKDGPQKELTGLVDRIQTSAERMAELIENLLDLSRTSTRSSLQYFQLNDSVNAAIEALSLNIEQSGATFSIDQLHGICGDPIQITQLFQNLISNAIRYRHPDRDLFIKIGYDSVLGHEIPSAKQPGIIADFYHQIQIEDNGIGFEQQHASRIFELFQRLHGRSSYQGTGIGLAICRQVVENHNGVIYASGSPDQGAVFTILLPMDGKQ